MQSPACWRAAPSAPAKSAGIRTLLRRPEPKRTAAAETRALASRAEAGIDHALVRRFKAGDLAAFDEIVARHRKQILSLAEH